VPASSIRLVVDTNVILRGLLNTGSASGRVLDIVEKQLVLLLLSTDSDLLSLPASHGDAAKRIRQRLPKLRIVSPADFLDANAAELGSS